MTIRRKLMLLSFVIVIIPIFASLFFVYSKNRISISDEIRHHLKVVVQNHADRFMAGLEHDKERLALVSSRTQLRISLNKFIRKPEPEYQAKMNKILKDACSSIPSFQSISVAALDGRIVASTSSDLQGTSIPGTQQFIKGLREARADMLFLEDGRVWQYLTGPLIFDGRKIGVLVIRKEPDYLKTDAKHFSDMHASEDIILAKKDAQGNAVFITPLRFDPDAALKRKVSFSKQNCTVIDAFKNPDGFFENSVDYRGEDVFAASIYLKDPGWAVIGKLDKKEAFSSLNQLRNLLVTIGIISVVTALLLSYLFARTIVKPLEKLAALAADIGDGKFDGKSSFKSNDEISMLGKKLEQMSSNLYSFQKQLKEENEKHAQTREELLKSQESLKAMLQANPDPVVVYNDKGFPRYLNPAFSKVFGWSFEELDGKRIPFVPEDQKELTVRKVRETFESGQSVKFITKRLTREGSILDVLISSAVLKGPGDENAGMVVNVRDISEQLQLEAQLLQAQKMESVGRLAGGVAHDFNNILSVIMGKAELALFKVAPEHEIYADLKEIQNAALRSANIVRQLLAFARKQTISPQVININITIQGMLKMLGRLVGEDISISWYPGKALWKVNIDPSQVDQIMANLCVNARDAIADVGNIIIETSNAALDHTHCRKYPECIPGDYVQISISDNGCGMDKTTLENLFEPFYTTKEVGKGTGLGLSTVYGIVKQNNGFIYVFSEKGQGTNFKVYLPRHEGETDSKKEKSSSEDALKGSETILLVEDDGSILELTGNMLKRLGYTVYKAATPDEAIRLSHSSETAIHLLMTDVVMPLMNGRELAARISHVHPGIKSLFMSGYTADIIANRGVLDKGVNFIGKPFLIKELSVRLREILDP